MREHLTIAFRVGLCLIAVSCANSQTSQWKGSQILHMESPELQTVQFKSGRPGIGDDLFQSLLEPNIALQQMRENAKLIKRISNKQFNVIGSTDDVECAAVECDRLSQRRATAVVDWLIKHGVPKSSLIPKSQGPYMGPGAAYTEGERRISRRVEIRIFISDAERQSWR
ncbi:OmpA family protein [Lysobacter sp. CA199]|uniref:OmpA family protein n=1 Tax=Lysobacter sp. CA199 TaxID=3455608 RepID=UPI003F8D843C